MFSSKIFLITLRVMSLQSFIPLLKNELYGFLGFMASLTLVILINSQDLLEGLSTVAAVF